MLSMAHVIWYFLQIFYTPKGYAVPIIDAFRFKTWLGAGYACNFLTMVITHFVYMLAWIYAGES